MSILSFVIPAYNSAHFLETCLHSMVSAGLGDKIEIIVVNDGSTDQTVEFMAPWCEKYGNIRLITQSNRGHGGALNTGCAAATGKYLKVVDADDWVETENLPALLSYLEASDSDVVLCHHYTRDITTGEVRKWKSFPEEFGRPYTFEEILPRWKDFDRSLTFHGIIYNTEFYHRYGISLSEHVFYEDHEYATFPCCHAGSILPLDLFLYHYRVGDVQQSVSDENQLKRIGHTETVLLRMLREYELQPCGEAGRAYIARKAQGLLISYLTTALLVSHNKKQGRELAAQMMDRFRQELPAVAESTGRQYAILGLLNRLHVSKAAMQRVLRSRVYNTLRHNHDFN